MGDQSQSPSGKLIRLAFPLPKAPRTQIHINLTINKTSILLFLTTVEEENTSAAVPLGSFVYALPDRFNPGQTLSTPLFTYESSVEFTTRMAQLLAKKSGTPAYVGNSMSFTSAGMGGTVEEEIEAFKKVVEVVMGEINKTRNNVTQTNGINGH